MVEETEDMLEIFFTLIKKWGSEKREYFDENAVAVVSTEYLKEYEKGEVINTNIIIHNGEHKLIEEGEEDVILPSGHLDIYVPETKEAIEYFTDTIRFKKSENWQKLSKDEPILQPLEKETLKYYNEDMSLLCELGRSYWSVEEIDKLDIFTDSI
jgi:hypothetical protein